MAAHSGPPAFPLAPDYALPSTSHAIIEYPGPVASTSTAQFQAAKTLGGPSRLSKALHSDNGIVELNFRPDVTFSHAVGGETVQAGNIILLKVTKRRRRRTDKTRIEGESVVPDHGVYKVEAVGVVDKLVRFRSMADLQYQPQNMESDETIKLGKALRTMDVQTMQQYRFPEPSEDYDKDLHLLPPPVFSRLTLPQIYSYRPNPLSVPVTITKSNGSEVTRLVNKAKYKGELVITLPFSTPASEIPMGPAKPIPPNDTRAGLESATLEKVNKLFEKRPIWSRNALCNQITRQERSRTQNLKLTLPFVSWTFSDGPFRDSCIRFGYDPRTDPQARFYQRIMIRNMANSRAYLKRIAGGSNNTETGAEAESDERSHIFDGETAHRNVGNYQLCDIIDPFLQEVIQNTDFVRDTCDSRDGWWDGEYTEFIRQILKRKFLALLNEGIQLPNDSFDDLFEYLDTYRAQRGYTHQHHQTNDTTMTVASDDIEQNGDYANEMEDQVNNLTQKKLVSLRDKGKRNQKPKAITLNDGLRDRARSRNSLIPNRQSMAPDDEGLENTNMEQGQQVNTSEYTGSIGMTQSLPEDDT